MSEDGADKAGENISTGIKLFLILGVIFGFIFGMAYLYSDYKKTELMQPTLQQSDSLASSHTSSEKLPSSHSE